MVAIHTVSSICLLCAGLNVMYIISSVLKIHEDIVPYGKAYFLLSTAVSAISLSADIMMLKAIKYGNVSKSATNQEAAVPKTSLKLMEMALSTKLFVIAFEFFAPTVYNYNAAQSALIGWDSADEAPLLESKPSQTLLWKE
ncbi:uncharacterized protein LOC144119657 [Amblyomma americanum]